MTDQNCWKHNYEQTGKCNKHIFVPCTCPECEASWKASAEVCRRYLFDIDNASKNRQTLELIRDALAKCLTDIATEDCFGTSKDVRETVANRTLRRFLTIIFLEERNENNTTIS